MQSGSSQRETRRGRVALLAAPWVVAAFLGGLVLGPVLLPADPGPHWPSYAPTYDRLAPVVVNVSLYEPEHRLGSGFAIGPRRVVTARHLVVGAEALTVRAVDGREVGARVVGTDARTDLALVEVDSGAELQVAELGTSTHLQIGDTVLAIGNPYGLGHSLTVGVVGSRERRLEGSADASGEVEYIQLSMPLNPGNSGGPLFDESGRVVGILAGTHAKGQSIAFAVPVEVLLESLPALQQGERMSRAFLGVRTEVVNGALLVRSAIPTGPAAQAGVLAGDEILQVNGEEVTTPDALRALLYDLPAGSSVALSVRREGEVHELEGQLSDWAEYPVVVAGMTLRPHPGTGGRVVAVRPRSRAEEAGVQVADVIRTVNGRPVQAPADVQEVLTGGAPAQLEVERSGVLAVIRL